MKILGFGIIALFYGAYLGKMLAQRRKGIRTDQLAARGKKRDRTFYTELALKTVNYLLVLVQLVSLARRDVSAGAAELAGAAIALTGCLCFILAAVTMRDSWRAGIPENEETKFVTKGIYTISRNPAFLGFDLFYLGLCLLTQSPVLWAVSLAAVLLLHLQILEEEKYLARAFDREYLNYRSRVCRYLGRK